MIDQTNKAIIFCAHGSRDGTYNSNFLKLIKTLKSITDTENIFHCYIEKNRPLIKETINEVSQRYKQIYFYPLMFFDGYHMNEDIKKEVEFQKNQNKIDIKLIEKISLTKDLANVFIKEISKKLSKRKKNMLIISYSKSSKSNVIKEVKKYLKKISNCVEISKICCVGEEINLFKNIHNNKIKNLNIILHPIFFFEGFLYKINLINLKKITNFKSLKPISHYSEVVDILIRKING